MRNTLIELALALGPIYLIGSAAVPLVFAGVGLLRFFGEANRHPDGAVWLCASLAAVSAVLFIPPYVNTWQRCQTLKQEIAQQRALDEAVDELLRAAGLASRADTVTAKDLEYVQNKCDDMPFL